jgi:hypothetical protein
MHHTNGPIAAQGSWYDSDPDPPAHEFRDRGPKVFKAVPVLDAAARQGQDPVLVELARIR